MGYYRMDMGGNAMVGVEVIEKANFRNFR